MSPIGTWCERNVPSTGLPSTSFGPVHPLGVRRMIMGHRGRALNPLDRASSWIALILSSAVSRVAARKGDLLEQALQALLIFGDVGIDLAVSAFEVSVRHDAWPAVARAGYEEDLHVPFLDNAVQVDVNEVEPWRRAPVSEEA